MSSSFNDLPERLDRLDRKSLYRRRRVVDSPQGREIIVAGRSMLNFCSNDYLGLANDARVREAFKAGIDRWGVGSGASHLVCGHTAAHHELEEALADLTQRPRALFFSSGYAANLGIINALVGARDQVFEDQLNHASLLDGGWISRANFHFYAHASVTDLAVKLDQANSGKQLIVSDGVFSMDGDRCPLEGLAEMAGAHEAWLMIDDAHGFGVSGKNGAGTVDPGQYSTAQVPVLMATLGKAIGTSGAFVAGEEALIEFLIQRARNYIYTTALPSAVAVASLKALAIMRDEAWRRDKLEALITTFRNGAAELGIELMPSNTSIQPVLIGNAEAAVAAAAALEVQGILITPIRPPTVPRGTSRLRITLTAAHETADIERLLEALEATLGAATARPDTRVN